ncbi:MAG TPA: DNA-binding response regulator [Anaerolineaceae bacterium]|nr:DNA-binding response regulator [Anaerolineaceae bacterium]
MIKPIVRALVVDDDRAWQDILSEILSDAGLVVDTAASYEAAANLIHSYSHRIAIVDLSLLGEDPHNVDGLKVLESIRRQDPGCNAVLLTGYATVELAVNAIKTYGAYTCLQKEIFQRRKLREIVEKVLASAPALSSGVAFQTAENASQPGGRHEPAHDSVQAVDLALVVEDDAGWREILGEILRDEDFRVRLCGSYGEAIGCLRREKYSLAVVDLSLEPEQEWRQEVGKRELEGSRLLATIRAESIPTVVVSGVAAPAEIERAFQEQGVFAFLEKQTFDRHTFSKTIKEARKASRHSIELETLTGREQEIFKLLSAGQTNQEIAETLVVSVNTVKRHLKSIFHKLDIHTRSAAVAKAASIRPRKLD